MSWKFGIFLRKEQRNYFVSGKRDYTHTFKAINLFLSEGKVKNLFDYSLQEKKGADTGK